jgi:hypothetical protein
VFRRPPPRRTAAPGRSSIRAAPPGHRGGGTARELRRLAVVVARQTRGIRQRTIEGSHANRMGHLRRCLIVPAHAGKVMKRKLVLPCAALILGANVLGPLAFGQGVGYIKANIGPGTVLSLVRLQFG